MRKHGTMILLILIPVLILGLVSVMSNIVSNKNIKSVNNSASEIADNSMLSIEALGEIRQDTQSLHTQALSHIVATDLDSMLDIVEGFAILSPDLRLPSMNTNNLFPLMTKIISRLSRTESISSTITSRICWRSAAQEKTKRHTRLQTANFPTVRTTLKQSQQSSSPLRLPAPTMRAAI